MVLSGRFIRRACGSFLIESRSRPQPEVLSSRNSKQLHSPATKASRVFPAYAGYPSVAPLAEPAFWLARLVPQVRRQDRGANLTPLHLGSLADALRLRAV